jgi:hypothetical protein
MEAVSFITQTLKADVIKEGSSLYQIKSLRDVFLDADITEFLCEAMATMHNHLLEYVSSIASHISYLRTFPWKVG